MAADDLQAVYLIAGGDGPKVERAVARLRARFASDAVELHHAESMTGDDAVAACNAMGLFGDGTRLVLVEGVESWKAADVKAIGGYVTSPAPGTTLALVAGELKKDSPLGKAVTGHGTVLLWDVTARKIPQWIAEQFKVHGVKAEPEACRLLSELVGNDLYELASEVDKLATWAGDDVVTEADVEALVTPRAESPPWALTDAWGARDVAGVLRAAERMLDRTGDPVSRTLPRLVGSLTNHVRRARAIQRLEEQGLSSSEAASRLGIKPYPAQKLYGQVRNFSPAELDDALVRLADLDHAVKGGSRLATELQLERALIDITERA